VRATSTVVDAAVFLLLVSAAVGTLTLAGTTPPADDSTADATADALATSTATVHYTLAPGARRADSGVVNFTPESGPAFQRTAHGTLADHLGRAAMGNLTLAGERLSHARADYERAVANATRNVTRGRDRLARIEAVWEPYRGAPIRGYASAGPVPPTDADVHAATVTVASGVPRAGDRARAVAANGTVRDVGHAVAESVVRGLFPPGKTRTALRGDYPVQQLVLLRYERAGRLLGTNVTDRALADDTAGANEQLATALGEWFAADMRTRFASPERAAAAVSTGEVRITVRTWSP